MQYRYEPLEYLLQNGLPELAMECWEDVGDAFHSNIFAPDWKRYKDQEEERSLGFIAMREDDKLVGYAVLKINTDIHQKEKRVALLHDIYITKKKRGHAFAFMREVEKYCRMMKVERIDGAENIAFDYERGGVGRFYEYMGFEPIEVIWSKILVEEGNA